jgi:hypothetical protein
VGAAVNVATVGGEVGGGVSRSSSASSTIVATVGLIDSEGAVVGNEELPTEGLDVVVATEGLLVALEATGVLEGVLVGFDVGFAEMVGAGVCAPTCPPRNKTEVKTIMANLMMKNYVEDVDLVRTMLSHSEAFLDELVEQPKISSRGDVCDLKLVSTYVCSAMNLGRGHVHGIDVEFYYRCHLAQGTYTFSHGSRLPKIK